MPDTPLPDLAQHTSPLQHVGLPADHLLPAFEAEPLAVLYFLRHLGCAHCKFVVRQLRKLREQNTRFPPVVFVHMEGLAEAEPFFRREYPDAVHIADPTRTLYRLFGIRRANVWQTFGPRAIWAMLRRFVAGHSNALVPKADGFMLSGMFLVRNGQVIWAHRAAFAGDDDVAVQRIAALGGKPNP